jgi:CRISPR/Cas system-associated exonuclease Cas4 (RecB family)
MEWYVDAAYGEEKIFATKREIDSFTAARTALDSHVSSVFDQEAFLYSDLLEIAGACDLVGNWDGVPSIIDFKTSSNVKSRHEIENYWLQTTAYSIMYEELTGIRCDQLVIVMANVDEAVANIHVGQRTPELEDKLTEAREMYRVMKGF